MGGRVSWDLICPHSALGLKRVSMPGRTLFIDPTKKSAITNCSHVLHTHRKVQWSHWRIHRRNPNGYIMVIDTVSETSRHNTFTPMPILRWSPEKFSSYTKAMLKVFLGQSPFLSAPHGHHHLRNPMASETFCGRLDPPLESFGALLFELPMQ